MNNEHTVRNVLESLQAIFSEKNKDFIQSLPSVAKIDDKEIRRAFFKNTIKAVKKNGLLLQCFDEEYRNPGLSFLAVKKNGNALEFVPEKHKSLGICLKATQQNPEAIKFVPEKFKSLCQTQIDLKKQKNQFPIGILRKIFSTAQTFFRPELDRNSQLLVKIFHILDHPDNTNKQNQEKELTEYFRRLPNEMKNYDLCRRTIEYSPRLFPYIPQNFQIGELCKSIVSQNYQALNDIPEIEKDITTCLIAYLNNEKALSLVPSHLKKEVIEKALAFHEAQSNIQKQSDLDIFLHQYGKIIDYVLPEDFIKTEMLKINSNTKTDHSEALESETEIKEQIQNNIKEELNNKPYQKESTLINAPHL